MKIIISGTVDIDPEQMEAAMNGGKALIEGALTQEESWTMTGALILDPRTDSRL